MRGSRGLPDNLISAVGAHHLCLVLCITRSQGPTHTQGEEAEQRCEYRDHREPVSVLPTTVEGNDKCYLGYGKF